MPKTWGTLKEYLKTKVKASWAWLADLFHACAAVTRDFFGW